MKLTPELRTAKAVLLQELRLYDAVARSSKLRFERPSPLCERFLGPSFSCAHHIMLYDVCHKCGRTTTEDLYPYWVALQSRIKELLAVLDRAGKL